MNNNDKKIYNPGAKAPNTPTGCWCQSYEDAWEQYKYWRNACAISMFFHGMISFPIIIAVISVLIERAAG